MFRKYLTVFSISWSNGFVYRLNFLLWRFRSLVIVLAIYFLWDAIFQNNGVIFGYNREKILTYVFLTLILRSVVLGQRSMDIAGEIADGRLANYLLKPINYHLYWFVRDIADKILNIIFSVFEVVTLYFILRPPVFIQTDLYTLLIFLIFVVGAIIINYLLGNIASNLSFWTQGNSWGFWFVYLLFQDYLGGVMFPLDVLPNFIYSIIRLLPFPYLLFFPANVYLGKIDFLGLTTGFIVLVLWIFILTFIITIIWKKGLKIYQAEGR